MRSYSSIALFSSQDPAPAFDSDFSAGTLGDFGAVPDGWTIVRSGSGRSVQISENTILLATGLDFAGSNKPRCGQFRGASSRGLMVEGAVMNVGAWNSGYPDPQNIANDLRDISDASPYLGAGAGPPVYSAGSGSPDGVSTAKRCQVPSGGYGQYRYQKNAPGGSGSNPAWPCLTYSTWQKSAGQIQQLLRVFNGAVTIGKATERTLSGAWERIVTTLTGIPAAYENNRYHFPVVGVDETAEGGAGPFAIDTEVDCPQIEYRRYAGSYVPADIAGSVGTMNGELLQHPNRESLIFSGRLCIELTFYPFAASDDLIDDLSSVFGSANDANAIMAIDADNRVWFDPVTQQITSRVNASEYTFGASMSWTAVTQRVQTWLEVGNGTTRFLYRTSNDHGATYSAPVSLGAGTTQDPLPSGAGTIEAFSRAGTINVLPACVSRIRVFDNTRPLWAA